MTDIYGDVSMKGGRLYEDGNEKNVEPIKISSTSILDDMEPLMFGGNIGIFAGGFQGGNTLISNMEYINFTTMGDSSVLGSLWSSCWHWGMAGLSNGANNRGIFAGGYVWWWGWCETTTYHSRVIQYMTINSLATAADFGSLILSTWLCSGHSNGTLDRGIIAGGHQNNVIQYITISSLSNAVDFGDLLREGRTFDSMSNDINNRGIFSYIWNSGDSVCTKDISYITITSLSDAMEFGELSYGREGGMSSNGKLNRGVFLGGYEYRPESWLSDRAVPLMQYIDISNTGNAENFGKLVYSAWARTGTSNLEGSLGVTGGGYTGSDPGISDIERLNIQIVPSNSALFGSLQSTRYHGATCSNGIQTILNVGEVLPQGGLVVNLEDHTLNIVSYSLSENYISENFDKQVSKIYPQFDYQKGLFIGGTTEIAVTNSIEEIDIDNNSNATSFNTLTTERNYPASTSNASGNRAVIAGGWNDVSLISIEYLKIFGGGDSSYFSNLTEARYGVNGTSNADNNRGIFASGWSTRNTIDYITISSPGTHALDFGDLLVGRGGTATTSNAVGNKAVFGGGYNGHDDIEYVNINSLSDGLVFGNLTANRYGITACSNSLCDRALFIGGYQSSVRVNIIEYISISIPANADDFGDISEEIRYAAATSNGHRNRGIRAGGNEITNVIEYVNIVSLSNMDDFGDLIYGRYQLTATSNSD